MKTTTIDITPSMAIIKHNLPEWTWDDIVKCGMAFARIIDSEDNPSKYKKLYWLSKTNPKCLCTSCS